MVGFKQIFSIFGIIFLSFTLALNIVGAGLVCATTNNCKPLMENTVGQFLGSQALMKTSIEWIKANPDANSALVDSHKQVIYRCLLISIFVIYLMWYLLDKIALSFVQNEHSSGTIIHVFMLSITIVIIYLSNVLYLGFYYGRWDFMPFSGFVSFVQNAPVIFQSFGRYVDPFLNASEAINATGLIV